MPRCWKPMTSHTAPNRLPRDPNGMIGCTVICDCHFCRITSCGFVASRVEEQYEQTTVAAAPMARSSIAEPQIGQLSALGLGTILRPLGFIRATPQTLSD